MSNDIIEMAKQVGCETAFGLTHPPILQAVAFKKSQLEAFVKLVEKRKCEELAKKIEAMPFGTTGESFAVWIREQA